METIAGRYEILEILGAGGMGKVYKARLLQTGDLLAIKQLRAENKQSDAIERFSHESQALRDLNHPNIVRIHEAFQEDNEQSPKSSSFRLILPMPSREPTNSASFIVTSSPIMS